MQTFQLLKSGTSFKKDRIEKVKSMFDAPAKSEEKVKVPDNDNDLQMLDEQIAELKTSKPKDMDAFNKKVASLVNKRRDTLNHLRKKYHIKVEGDQCPQPLFSFPQIAKAFASKHLMTTVKGCGYTKPTPVQMQAIPIMKEKRSAIVLAETGSGKSFAFAVPLLEMIKRGEGLKAIVLAPTRELTIQIYKEFLILSENHLKVAPRVKFMRSTMVPESEDGLKKLTESCEILIASPLKMA